MITGIKDIYLSHLDRNIAEINLYTNENAIWEITDGISNSAGNLTLHIVGNLQFFIGTYLGNTGYVRDRDAEFNLKNLSRIALINMLEDTKNILNTTISALNNDSINQCYPMDKFGEGKSIGYVLVYLLAHLDYHLGQINYHRRLLNK